LTGLGKYIYQDVAGNQVGLASLGKKLIVHVHCQLTLAVSIDVMVGVGREDRYKWKKEGQKKRAS
jgi:hypothetical protein